MADALTQALRLKLEGARQLTAKAREKAAGALLNIHAVSEHIAVAASGGLEEITLTPEAPGLDLRRTPAATETVRRLAAAGFAVEWVPRQPRPDGPTLWALRVSWAARS